MTPKSQCPRCGKMESGAHACRATAVCGGPSHTDEKCKGCGKKWKRYRLGSFDWEYKDCLECEIKKAIMNGKPLTTPQPETAKGREQGMTKLADKLRKRLSMTGREFWIDLCSYRSGLHTAHWNSEQKKYETVYGYTICYDRALTEKETDINCKLIHVTEKTDRAEIDGAILAMAEALEFIETQTEQSESSVDIVLWDRARQALAELSRALDKTEAG